MNFKPHPRLALMVKGDEEIWQMEEAGRVVGLVHARIEAAISPGVTTAELDEIARETLDEAGAASSFLGYHGFPAHICTSVNSAIVHGIPGPRRLSDGDVITVDVGAKLGGFHGDSAWTYGVGHVSDEAAALLSDTEEALQRAVEVARSGNHLGAIGFAVESLARERGRSAVQEYGGHGIGRSMHEDPHVPNHGRPDRGLVLKTGMTVAIEPMLTTGSGEATTCRDGWTVVTRDRSLAAHFEHTVVVTPNGGRVLTPRLAFVVN